MNQCQWKPCEERATMRVEATGTIDHTEDLCVEHANRARDNLISAGCTVTVTAIPPTCDYEHELWGPNEGCAEFMDEPEAVVTCGKPAVRVFHVVFHAPYGEDEHETLYACDEHNIEDDMFTTVRAVGLVG